MTKFTPQELLTVAQRVMPNTTWYTDTGNNKVYCLAEITKCRIYLDPETNHEQWRALAEFCSTYPHRFALFAAQDGLDKAHAIGPAGSALMGEGSTLAEAMTAAVLALEVCEK